jgi:hypothetical protein
MMRGAFHSCLSYCLKHNADVELEGYIDMDKRGVVY